MRFWFSLGLFVFSFAYFFYGMNTLNFLTPSGRPGPGYFPGLVGVGLILVTGINLVKDILVMRESGATIFSLSALSGTTSVSQEVMDTDKGDTKADVQQNHHPKDVMIVVSLVAALILMLTHLGGLLSMVVFMLLLLSVMNPRMWTKNISYSLLLPLFLYLLFDVWLNASLPIGIFGI
ncbi:Tripartite tricarboxylate transporter TctB family protein [Franzmannia pantelleriensis]|uniref:Tripartite tricarboxylate transporter TctB family protein n=1 Tax=Franzmannia pantelleriensis TaxID=48727 RepID=A0A1G9HYF7_9GAMM|nr:tripartite tricarboxylate transporter TctB family protein [Halomonas pantelleriensis]SDL17999.1 Tripartite tricarboxylate transporter TctB family protein [Halomonas pantelleriensis]